MRRRFITSFITTAAILLVVVVLLANVQRIRDWIALHGYQPSNAVAALATESDMTDYARHIYYVNHPQISSADAFRSECGGNREQSIVLGCYHGNQRGIYILSVTDSRLDGVEEVTAAHEMLHAAYERLSNGKKAQVDGWLTDYYQHDLRDQRIKDTIDGYKKSEPTEVINEMHSIFGTEVADLPANLQNYYTQYFTNRSVVTAAAAKYQQEFSSRRQTIEQDDAQLAAWRTEISKRKSTVQSQSIDLQAQRTQINQLRTNPSAYNAAIVSYNKAVDDYNAQVGALRELIDQYNQLVAERNKVAGEITTLTAAISNQTAPTVQQ